MNRLLIILMLTGLIQASYTVGDTVTFSDQNVEKTTCYAGNGYFEGDIWKLVDWNAEYNGGNYNVIFIQFHASW